MVLRKCPACREVVGAESIICPRCGAHFRAVVVRRFFFWILVAAAIFWAVCHFLMKHS